MIGPSSSHTAAAVRIGLITRALLGEPVASARILLHGSFAHTGKGHGTDKALVAGLLGYDTADDRIRDALKIAEQAGMDVKFSMVDLGDDYHVNTARLTVTGESGLVFSVTASSVGGGNINVVEINGLPIQLSGEEYTLVTIHMDRPGVVAKATSILSENNVNISSMTVSRVEKGGMAAMAIAMDHQLPPGALDELREMAETVRVIPPIY